MSACCASPFEAKVPRQHLEHADATAKCAATPVVKGSLEFPDANAGGTLNSWNMLCQQTETLLECHTGDRRTAGKVEKRAARIFLHAARRVAGTGYTVDVRTHHRRPVPVWNTANVGPVVRHAVRIPTVICCMSLPGWAAVAEGHHRVRTERRHDQVAGSRWRGGRRGPARQQLRHYQGPRAQGATGRHRGRADVPGHHRAQNPRLRLGHRKGAVDRPAARWLRGFTGRVRSRWAGIRGGLNSRSICRVCPAVRFELGDPRMRRREFLFASAAAARAARQNVGPSERRESETARMPFDVNCGRLAGLKLAA